MFPQYMGEGSGVHIATGYLDIHLSPMPGSGNPNLYVVGGYGPPAVEHHHGWESGAAGNLPPHIGGCSICCENLGRAPFGHGAWLADDRHQAAKPVFHFQRESNSSVTLPSATPVSAKRVGPTLAAYFHESRGQ